MSSQRKIIHIDMDAFYASVEQHDQPKLKGKPIAVGGGKNRGVVAAASYEARKFGIRSAMSSKMALELCPHLIFIKPRFERYREISSQIREIFHEYTDLVEPLSLDEAYLDVTNNKKNKKSATFIAEEIRRKIFQKTGLTASAGISVNKFVAKIASDYHKPNGQKTVTEEEIIDFLDPLDIRKFYGIGKVTAEKMYVNGIFTGADLRSKSLEFLKELFGNSAEHYYLIARGIHTSPVKPYRIVKSVGAERTFQENIFSEVHIIEPLSMICEEVSQRLEKKSVAGRTITLKIKYSNFTIHTRSRTLIDYIFDKEHIEQVAKELLYQEPLINSVRLLGLTVSNLNNQPREEPKYIQLKIPFVEYY